MMMKELNKLSILLVLCFIIFISIPCSAQNYVVGKKKTGKGGSWPCNVEGARFDKCTTEMRNTKVIGLQNHPSVYVQCWKKGKVVNAGVCLANVELNVMSNVECLPVDIKTMVADESQLTLAGGGNVCSIICGECQYELPPLESTPTFSPR
jgi:hypothetical protein